jgi:anti-repressor protein
MRAAQTENSRRVQPAGATKGNAVQDLIPFTYESTDLRVVAVNGAPWFVAKDVCNILGLGNVGQALIGLDDDEKSSIIISDGTPGNPNKAIISESGLYSLVLRSRKPEARAFKRWVTHDVIPAVRRHGGYLTPAMTEQVLSDPDTIIRLATDLKRERAARVQLEAQREMDAPKILFANAVATSHTSVLVGDLAKILKGNGVEIGGTRLFKVLRDEGFLIRREGSDWNMPTQKSMELGLFEIKETAITHSDGHVTVNKTPKVTGKGQQYFVERFLDGRLEAVA